MVDKHSQSLLNKTDLYVVDPVKWSLEHFDIAVNKAYKDISENTIPSNEYISDRREIAERQLVIAGYRLAAIIRTLGLATLPVNEGKFLN